MPLFLRGWPWNRSQVRRSDRTDSRGGPTSGGHQTGEDWGKLSLRNCPVRCKPTANGGANLEGISPPGGAPVGIAIELSDQQAQVLSETARRLNASEDELAAAAGGIRLLGNRLISRPLLIGCLRRTRSSIAGWPDALAEMLAFH